MNTKNIALLFLLAALWGPSFLFIKIAVLEMEPITVATLRIALAALVLYIILKIRKGSLPKPGKVWLHMIVAGFFAMAFPFVLISWGEVYVDSSLAAILNGTTPLFTIVIAHFFTKNDKMDTAKVFGAVIGFIGLILLLSPSFTASSPFTIIGIIVITIAALSYGFAAVYIKNNLTDLKPMVGPTAQLIVASVILIPFALMFDDPLALSEISNQAIFSIFFLAVFGTAIAFILYYVVLERTSASFLSMCVYIVPVFGVILGVMVLDEQLGWATYAGCGLILSGVMVANKVFNPLSKLKIFRKQPGTTKEVVSLIKSTEPCCEA